MLGKSLYTFDSYGQKKAAAFKTLMELLDSILFIFATSVVYIWDNEQIGWDKWDGIKDPSSIAVRESIS